MKLQDVKNIRRGSSSNIKYGNGIEKIGNQIFCRSAFNNYRMEQQGNNTSRMYDRGQQQQNGGMDSGNGLGMLSNGYYRSGGGGGGSDYTNGGGRDFSSNSRQYFCALIMTYFHIGEPRPNLGVKRADRTKLGSGIVSRTNSEFGSIPLHAISLVN